MTKSKKYILVIGGFLVLLVTSILFIKSRATRAPNLKTESSKEAQLKKVKIPILMYHYVEYNQDERDFLRDQQNVPPNVFENQLITLRKAGYTFITPRDISQVLKGKTSQKYIIISFDDGFRDFYTDAYPILKKHNVPAINYITYNYLNGQDYMTTNMVQEIAKDPLIEIGSHTLNHAYLLDISEGIAYNEIKLSKDYLEQAFGVIVTSFAYPFGNYNAQIIELVKRAGYSTAVTVDSGGIVRETDLFKLKRVRPGHLGGDFLIKFLEEL